MRTFPFLSIAAITAFIGAASVGAESPGTSGGFAIVELFTSEGCSSCPPADEALTRLSESMARENLPVFVLEWHVDYWDYLGWKDPYDSRAATERQYSYSRALPSSVYTPQVVINGSIVPDYASDLRSIDRTVRSLVASPSAAGLRVQVSPNESPAVFTVRADTSGVTAGAKVLLVLVEDGLGALPTAGENAGRRLSHSSVVRSVTTLPAAGGETRIEAPAGFQAARGRLVGIVQDARTMRILTAAQVRLPVRSAGDLTGRVIDGRGRAVTGAMVQACSDVKCVPTYTDARGAFVFRGLEPGRYAISVDAGAHPLEVTLESGRPFVLGRPIVLTR